MLVVLGKITILSDKIEEWEAVFGKRRAQVLRDEDYTLRYDLYRSAETPGEYIVIEAFAGADDLDRHLKASVGHEAMIACFAGTPVVEKYEPVENCT